MNADPIAGSYRWLEYAAFGRALEHSRFDFLSYAVESRRVLILGEGDGRFLARFLRCNRHATVEVVESSGRMIQLARQRVLLAERSRVEFHQVDALAHSLPNGPFDLAVSHFFLDTLSGRDAEELISKVTNLLSPGADWLLSEFEEPPGLAQSLHARLWLRVMYRFFALTTGLEAHKLPPYRNLLERYGLREIGHRQRRLGLIRSQIWRKLR
jgi:SAM-dependent methyltransferase